MERHQPTRSLQNQTRLSQKESQRRFTSLLLRKQEGVMEKINQLWSNRCEIRQNIALVETLIKSDV